MISYILILFGEDAALNYLVKSNTCFTFPLYVGMYMVNKYLVRIYLNILQNMLNQGQMLNGRRAEQRNIGTMEHRGARHLRSSQTPRDKESKVTISQS